MELKYRLPIHPDGSLLHSFNRTFMELKFQKISDDAFESKRFNRTFMELKFRDRVLNCRTISVLIVPLWN